jgi:hypothetical protein
LAPAPRAGSAAIAQQFRDDGWRFSAVDLPKSGMTRAVLARQRNVLAIEGDDPDDDLRGIVLSGLFRANKGRIILASVS